MPPRSRARNRAILERAEPVSEMASEIRAHRALSIALAAMSFRGEIVDIERLLGLADEFLQYIEGDDSAPIPRPDKMCKGKMPRP